MLVMRSLTQKAALSTQSYELAGINQDKNVGIEEFFVFLACFVLNATLLPQTRELFSDMIMTFASKY